MNTVTAAIDKLRMWCAGGWKTYNINNSESNHFILRIHYDQLFILWDDRVLESLNLNGKMKGIYKDDVLILIFSNSNQIRKIKFQIKTNMTECLQKLSLHFPVANYKCVQSNNHLEFVSVEDVLKTAIAEKGTMTGTSLPPSMNDFIKLCLLDPVFPQIINEAEKFLKTL